MRHAILLSTFFISLAAAATASPAAAQTRQAATSAPAYCFRDYSANRCEFATLDQCLQELYGGAGQCIPNPAATGAGPEGAYASVRTRKQSSAQ